MTHPVLSRPVTEPREGLAVVQRLFECFQENEILYCHWKSNEHLGAAVRGDTDLDVLVDRNVRSDLEACLEQTGYKRIAAVPERAFAGVDDYLGFDESTGRLAHLHLHYRLVLGEKNLKGYRVPWESLVLSTRTLDPATGIFMSDPNVELILLLVRAALKLRRRDLPREYWKGIGLPSDIVDEFLWLMARVDADRLRSLGESLLGAEAAEKLVSMTTALPTAHQLRSFARAASPVLATYRTYGPFEATRRRWAREWQSRFGRFSNRVFASSFPVKHTLPRGGLVVAFLGSDGSGKSTVAREIASWLAWKLDVKPIYFGSGDGPVSLWRWPLRAALSLRANTRRLSRAEPAGKPATTVIDPGARLSRGSIYAIWRSVWSLALAREKLDRLAEARRVRNLGMVAICDRFPQNQVIGFNDGPQLSAWIDHSSGPRRAAARWEQSVYNAAERNPPDLVVKLNVTPEVAALRKDDMSPDDLTRRVRAVHSLRFPPEVRVIEIDATQALDAVLLQAKRAVWEAL